MTALALLLWTSALDCLLVAHVGQAAVQHCACQSRAQAGVDGEDNQQEHGPLEIRWIGWNRHLIAREAADEGGEARPPLFAPLPRHAGGS